MSVCRKLPDGTIQKIAGHTILLDANASEIRQGTWNLHKDSAGTMTTDITFTDPMPDTDYVVILEPSNMFNWETQNPGPIGISNKTTTGFTLSSYAFDMVSIFTGKYTAFKPVKIEGYTALQNKVSNPDDTPTIGSMNLVTSDGVARAIENASAVWKGTRAEWNALPATDKIKYDLAVLLDQTLVKAIDRTDGTETNVADLSGQFVGTHAEWEAETNKTQYKTAVLTDDRKTVNEVTGTGALNEVADDARIWRGTKAEWEAMSAAEKDEWDQAEIETIEAQGLNPFRTLSDPETLSIASGTDYTCPHDGFISCTSSTGGSAMTLYVNDVQIGQSSQSGGAALRDVVTIPVQKGDRFKVVYGGAANAMFVARWYTTDINPGNPIDYPVVHRSQSLDWDNAVYPTNAEMLAGWTAPSDGYFIDYSISSSGTTHLTINGLVVGVAYYNGSTWSSYGVQIPVVKGDVLKHTGHSYPWTNPVIFVPYKDYPDYSTTEHWTGRRWIDGKKIYSKVFTGLSVAVNPTSTWITVCSVPNSESLVKYNVKANAATSYGTDWSANALCMLDGGTCKLYNVGGLNMTVNSMILEYTKTTD